MLHRSIWLFVSALLVAAPSSFAAMPTTVGARSLISSAELADLPAPVANNLTITTLINTSRSITLSATHSSDGGAIKYTIKSAPAHGTLSVAVGSTTTGAVTYTPAAGHSGADAFTYSATDDVGESLDATVNITVQPAAAAPTVASLPTLSEWAMLSLGGLLAAMAYRQQRKRESR